MLSVKRILAALLASLMLIPAMVACSEDTAETPADTTAAAVEDTTTAETEPPETERSDAKDNLPAGLKFNGTTVTWVYRNEDWYLKWDVIGYDNSGEIIQDAIWQRNLNVEERFGITLNIQPTQVQGLSNVASELKNLVFPPRMGFNVPEGHGYTVLPRMQGAILPAGHKYKIDDGLMFERAAYIPTYGQIHDGCGYTAIIETPYDARYSVVGEEVQPYFITSLGLMRYPRTVSYKFFPQGDFS